MRMMSILRSGQDQACSGYRSNYGNTWNLNMIAILLLAAPTASDMQELRSVHDRLWPKAALEITLFQRS